MSRCVRFWVLCLCGRATWGLVGDNDDTAISFPTEEAFLKGLEEPQTAEQVMSSHLQWMRFLVSRSWWRAAKAMVLRAHQQLDRARVEALDFEVRLRTNDVKQEADQLMDFTEEAFRDQRQGLDEVHCALQWAQNSTTIFLGVKFASRWSAPGAIEIKDLTVNISERNFTLAAFGHHSSIRKRYVVDLPLFGLISSTGSSWSSASVGRATATLQKIAPEKWTKLTSSKSKHQITSWLDMEERWAEELRKASSPQKAAPKEAVAKAAADSSKKGQRVSISWQKRSLGRDWKRK
ncbi:CS domain-containing protein [Durusdinium trenchii]|uniref:CS domain-containing protein n=1 Tax=Durusdinium trenchii TaxID=1381693 RepID=A0ABP0I7W9_9DINO